MFNIHSQQLWYISQCVCSAIIALAGYFGLSVAVRKSTAPLKHRISSSVLSLLRFFSFYSLYFLLIASLLSWLGFNMTALLGAAGVFGVAIGFASQTTVSNIISGIFLMLEQSLNVGDLIGCDGVRGRIQEVGLLSVTLKTINNTIIRVPNEQLLKTTVTNFSAFHERAVNFTVSCPSHVTNTELKHLLDDAFGQLDEELRHKALSLLYTAGSSQTYGVSVTLMVPKKKVLKAKSDFIERVYQEAQKQKMDLYIAGE